MSTETIEAKPAEGLTYLVGETLFIRGIQIDDAKTAMAWRPSPFPISAQSLEEQLKKVVPEQIEARKSRLVVCRRSDGQPIGSVFVDDGGQTESFLRLYTDRTLGSAGETAQVEMLELLIPWSVQERHRPVTILTTDTSHPTLISAAERLGMRPAVSLREGAWRDGRLHDALFLNLPNPIWTALVGDPGPGLVHATLPVLAPSSPAPRRDPAERLTLPPNAMLGSARLALRPFQAEDAETVANAVLRDPDASFGHSRFPISPIVYQDWFEELGKKDPDSDFEVAVVLRETNELIGEVGLYSIDWVAKHAETGSWIYKPEHRGSGYGTEAKHLLLEWAFEQLGLNMLWSWVLEANPRSQAALRKQGYRDAGVTCWCGFGPKGFDNARMFDLLAAEWRSARGGEGVRGKGGE